MAAAEHAGRNAGRTLLVLDTEEGSPAEQLYLKCGYTRSGVIPQFALSAGGSLITTVVFYKLIEVERSLISQENNHANETTDHR